MSFATVPSSKNLILNPSAEVNATTGVTTSGAPTVTRDLTESWVGDASFKVVSATLGQWVRWNTGSGINAEFVEAVALGEIRAKGSPGVIVPLRLIASTHHPSFGDAETITDPIEFVMDGDWVTCELAPLEFSDVLSPGYTITAISVAYEPPNGAQTVYFDGVHVSDAEIDFYVDGDQGVGYTWDATAHNSISRRSIVQLNITPEGEIRSSALVSYRVEVRTQNNAFIRDISQHVVSGKVEANIYADSKISCQFVVREDGLTKDWVEWIAPFVRVEYPDGTVAESQVGLMVSITPSEETTWGGTLYTLEGRDALWLLSLRNPNLGYSIPKTKRRDVAIREILAGQGFTNVAIPPMAQPFPDVYKPTKENGYSYNEIMNDIADDVAHYNLWATVTGVITTMPYQDYRTSAVARTWKNGDAVFEPFTTESISTTLANHIVVRKDDPQNPIEWEDFNDDPDSPIAISKVGRITREIVNTDIADLAAAKAVVAQYKQEWASFQKNAILQTFLDPGRDLHEIYQLDFRDEDGVPLKSMTGRYWVKGWQMTIGRDVRMLHDLYRIEDYGVAA